MIPKAAILLLGLTFLYSKRRNLLFLWALAFSSVCLLNQQIVTGLQISNFHWNYTAEPSLTFLLFLIALDFYQLYGSKPVRMAVALLICAHSEELCLENLDPTRSQRTEELVVGYRNYKAQRFASQVPSLKPNTVVAGEQLFGNFATILEGSARFVATLP